MSRIRSWQAIRDAMRSHLPLLMRLYAHAASRHGAAEQNKARCAILGKVGVGMIMLHDPLKQAPGTRKASALVTDGRQKDIVCRGRIPDQLVLSAG